MKTGDTSKSNTESIVLRQIWEKVPEAEPWISLIKFEYPEGVMEVVLNDIPEDMARKIMMAFNA